MDSSVFFFFNFCLDSFVFSLCSLPNSKLFDDSACQKRFRCIEALKECFQPAGSTEHGSTSLIKTYVRLP